MNTLSRTFIEAVAQIERKLTPENKSLFHTVYAFQFKDTGESATLDLHDQTGRGWLAGSPEQFGLVGDFEVTLSTEDFVKLVAGALHPMAGMATGRMQLKGNIKEALLLDRLLKS